MEELRTRHSIAVWGRIAFLSRAEGFFMLHRLLLVASAVLAAPAQAANVNNIGFSAPIPARLDI
jgi:hypothetical protein